ncbi:MULTISPECIES: hypothetical protein [Pseudomonas syringae group]|uniref:Uncharacterized protein n=2 Tax=Pseudomonas syringae group TaxID=136849 RepID=A0AAE6QF83_9PSED|nr:MULTISPECIES: hypothetical protein [Pseudomonas syringae group]KTB79268.1 hypothetical protein AO069_10070 [Pseudomonas syringae pv. syringae PD2774]MCH5630178.1 hypothetical protein [Pseudomonas syringae pv. syringae]QGT80778.1 hypothetical protein GMO17_06090 [Pseudomonas coronafaciens pv. coronafaciens]QIQ73588.1 hypothetical protein HBB04_03994 [Pseudomonas coronafaciens]RMM81872.1 hypothetical protein ALQ71_02324 [Pseudomonas coronafaciens pv. striafaciens]
MQFYFVLDGLSIEQTNTLLSIESSMTGRSATAIFNLKTLAVRTNRDTDKAKAFVTSKLGAFLMEALEGLLIATGLDLIMLYHTVKGVPVVLTARPK